jgi:hypothetical protein
MFSVHSSQGSSQPVTISDQVGDLPQVEQHQVRAGLRVPHEQQTEVTVVSP